MVSTRNNGRCVSMRPSKNINAILDRPIKIELKDVWKNSGETGLYKIFLNEDDLGFNVIHMVSILSSLLMKILW
jgi:hypothetical protein